MKNDRYIFSQITDFIPRHELDKSIRKYNGNKRIRKLSCRDQFLSLVFGQLTVLRSLRGIVLCLSTFKWAYFELKKSAVKVHTQLDLKGNIPSFFLITKAKVHDVNFLDHIEYEKEAIYIFIHVKTIRKRSGG